MIRYREVQEKFAQDFKLYNSNFRISNLDIQQHNYSSRLTTSIKAHVQCPFAVRRQIERLVLFYQFHRINHPLPPSSIPS